MPTLIYDNRVYKTVCEFTAPKTLAEINAEVPRWDATITQAVDDSLRGSLQNFSATMKSMIVTIQNQHYQYYPKWAVSGETQASENSINNKIEALMDDFKTFMNNEIFTLMVGNVIKYKMNRPNNTGSNDEPP